MACRRWHKAPHDPGKWEPVFGKDKDHAHGKLHMSKPSRSFPRPLSELLERDLGRRHSKRRALPQPRSSRAGPTLSGPEIAAHSEPLKINWPRAVGDEAAEPATLVLRVEGPAALEIQHLSAVILGAGQPLLRLAGDRPHCPAPSPAAAPRTAAHHAPDPADGSANRRNLPDVKDDDLRQALGRLGAAIKRN